MAVRVDALTTDSQIAALSIKRYCSVNLISPSRRQIALLTARIISVTDLSVEEPFFDVLPLVSVARRVQIRVSAHPEFALTGALLSQPFDACEISSAETAVCGVASAPKCAAFGLETESECAYPVRFAEIRGEIAFNRFLRALRAKPVKTELKYVQSLLHCRELRELALPLVSDGETALLQFVSAILRQNRGLERVETQLGVLRRMTGISFGDPVKLAAHCAPGISVLIRSPERTTDTSASNDDEPPEIDVNLLFFEREDQQNAFSGPQTPEPPEPRRLGDPGNYSNSGDSPGYYEHNKQKNSANKLIQRTPATQHDSRSPREAVMDMYREVALNGFMAFEAQMGLCCVRLAASGARLELLRCSAADPAEIAEFMRESTAEADACINFDEISDYGLGDDTSPISHNVLCATMRGDQKYKLQLTVSPVALWIEEQDLFVAVVELIRFYEGKSLMYINVAKKYARRRVTE